MIHGCRLKSVFSGVLGLFEVVALETGCVSELADGSEKTLETGCGGRRSGVEAWDDVSRPAVEAEGVR